MSKYLKIILLCFLTSCLFTSRAAYLTNVPRTLIQPNGDTLNCFASGDEYYNWLHDANGYTIVQNPQTGYFVYASKKNGKIVPTSFVAGTCNPAAKGLKPWIKISSAEYYARRKAMVLPAKSHSLREDNINKGNFHNIVVFIRFADDSNFTNSFSYVNQMFNDSSNNYQANSLFDYFKRTSYNQLFITTSFYPQPNGDLILSYQDSLPRGYFVPWSVTDTLGYIENDSVHQRTPREHELLARAIAYIADMVPTDLNIDYNNDGLVDNVCFVIKGNVGDWNVLLWPHRWSLYTVNSYIHDKRVYDFNLQLADAGGYFSTSVMCHEMFHSLSAPDLYHYSDSTNMDPVGSWDLMCYNQNPPQQTCAYMKYKYGHWIDSTDLISLTQYGHYTIMPLNSETPDRICYKAATQDSSQFIMMDFRSHNDPFDAEVPGKGIIFYRVNTSFDGNSGYNGDDNLDGIYVFHLNGTTTQQGSIDLANFRGNSARHNFSPTTNPYPFLSNGDTVQLHITNFTNGTDSMEFDYLELVNIEDYAQSGYLIYPNPTSQTLHIIANNAQFRTMQVFNLYGQLMLSTVINESDNSINIANFAAGCYIIKITDQQQHISTLKFIKQ